MSVSSPLKSLVITGLFVNLAGFQDGFWQTFDWSMAAFWVVITAVETVIWTTQTFQRRTTA